MRRGAPRRARGTAIAVALLLCAGACSGGDSGDDETEEKGSGPPAVRAEVSVGEVTGRLPVRRRKTVVKQVGGVVDRWFEAAYLGDYPRRDFSDAFPGFTPGAVRLARRDRGLMSNAAIGPDVDAVVPVREVVRVDILSARKRAAGATARFRFVFRTDGERPRRVTVSGRLALTKAAGKGWRVFAYDVARSARPAGGKAS